MTTKVSRIRNFFSSRGLPIAVLDWGYPCSRNEYFDSWTKVLRKGNKNIVLRVNRSSIHGVDWVISRKGDCGPSAVISMSASEKGRTIKEAFIAVEERAAEVLGCDGPSNLIQFVCDDRRW